MSAIITDQIRILNAKNFVAGVSTSTNSYYAFVGLPNPTSIFINMGFCLLQHQLIVSIIWMTIMIVCWRWKDNLCWCKTDSSKTNWNSGTTYDYYRHDYSISNAPPNSGGTSLYTANYFVVNSDFRVIFAYRTEQHQKHLMVNHL